MGQVTIYLDSETSGLLKIQRWRVAFELFPRVKEVIVIRIWLDENYLPDQILKTT